MPRAASSAGVGVSFCSPFRRPCYKRLVASPLACHAHSHAWFSSKRETARILRDLWSGPIFWACAENSFRTLSQSDLSDSIQNMRRVTGSPWIADFRCWTLPEVAILGADQKECGLWGRDVIEDGGQSHAQSAILTNSIRVHQQRAWKFS